MRFCCVVYAREPSASTIAAHGERHGKMGRVAGRHRYSSLPKRGNPGIRSVWKPLESRGLAGVANAARTRDLLNHNQMLYQLSYSHHVYVSAEHHATDENYTRGFPENRGRRVAYTINAGVGILGYTPRRNEFQGFWARIGACGAGSANAA